MPPSRPLLRSFIVLFPAVLLGNTCGSATAVTDTASVRFVLAAPAGVSPFYVDAFTPDAQPGWLQVSHADGQRVWLAARCDIGDCGARPAVCGATVPMVRDISGAGLVDYTWDGMDSELDAASGCERRKPAAAGDYTVRFCASRTAVLTATGARGSVTEGTVSNPVCETVPFTLPASGEVRFQAR